MMFKVKVDGKKGSMLPPELTTEDDELLDKIWDAVAKEENGKDVLPFRDNEDIAVVIKKGNTKAIKELGKWLKHRRNKSATRFVFFKVRPSVERFLTDELTKGTRHFDIYTAACKLHAAKAIDAARGQYMRIVADLISSARKRGVTQARFRDLMRAETKRFIAEAFSSGLEDAGVFEAPSDEERDKIRELQKEPTPFIRDFAKQIYSKEGVSDAQASTKPKAWWASITPAYSAGLEAGGDNGMYKFTGVDGENPCVDCIRLEDLPDTHRKKAWKRRGLDLTGGSFVGQKTFCEGYQCEHFLERTTERAQGSF